MNVCRLARYILIKGAIKELTREEENDFHMTDNEARFEEPRIEEENELFMSKTGDKDQYVGNTRSFSGLIGFMERQMGSRLNIEEEDAVTGNPSLTIRDKRATRDYYIPRPSDNGYTHP